MKRLLAISVLVAAAGGVGAAQVMQPVRVGGGVKPPERIKYVAPVYPAEAQTARVSGIVIIEAVIDQQGTVADAHVLKSIPLLDEAAADAVRQWRYTPTRLNGVEVPVIMTVTVSFSGDMSNTAVSAPVGVPSISFGGGQSAMASNLPSTWNDKPIVRIGGDIAAPERTKYVAPVYPQDAQAARVSGVIIIEAIIDESGNVATAQVLKSVPMLDPAALDAVMQWKYTPTLLNGVAVPVKMTVTVVFTQS